LKSRDFAPEDGVEAAVKFVFGETAALNEGRRTAEIFRRIFFVAEWRLTVIKPPISAFDYSPRVRKRAFPPCFARG
jgi:hypothetical protein